MLANPLATRPDSATVCDWSKGSLGDDIQGESVMHAPECITICITLVPCTAVHGRASCAWLRGLRSYAERCRANRVVGATGFEPATFVPSRRAIRVYGDSQRR